MKLKANKREIKGKKVAKLREEGITPASVYGPKIDPISVKVSESEFSKAFNDVGYNKFIDLEVEGKETPLKVLVKGVSYHPIKDHILDISFYAVDEDSKVSVEIPVNLSGKAPAVAQNLGFLVQQLETITVYCLPKDLPDSIEVNVDSLSNTGESILISSINLPEGVQLDSSEDPNTAIVYIASFQKEIEEEDEVDEDEDSEGEEAEGEESEDTEGEESSEDSEGSEEEKGE